MAVLQSCCGRNQPFFQILPTSSSSQIFTGAGLLAGFGKSAQVMSIQCLVDSKVSFASRE